MIRTGTPADAAALAALINDAFQVEAFFKIGDRTTAADVAEMMTSGEFLMASHGALRLAGCVYVTRCADRGYFGMLSIAPPVQRQGIGQMLIAAAETWAAGRGCRFMDIHIVNLREELPPFYERLGYVTNGTLPFSHPERASRPCHFLVMTKSLAGR